MIVNGHEVSDRAVQAVMCDLLNRKQFTMAEARVVTKQNLPPEIATDRNTDRFADRVIRLLKAYSYIRLQTKPRPPTWIVMGKP